MAIHVSRRRFLESAAAGGALLGLSDLGFLSGLPAVSAADARPEPGRVRLRPEIEPLVKLIEESPRNALLEEIALRIRRGTSYKDVLTALMLAGVCNVQPRPTVGHKFHAVLVVNSAHLASLASPDSERWLPLFWGLDNFKSSQAQNTKESHGWQMTAVDESKVPTARQGAGGVQRRDGQVGRRGRRRSRGRARPHGRRAGGVRTVLPLRGPRLP